MSLEELRRQERAELCATLKSLGPEAPTLCSEWTSADIAAHLVVSEAYGGWPMVAAYRLRRVLPVAITRRGMQSLQAVGDRQIRRTKARGWPWLLARLAGGPPKAYRREGVAHIRLVEEWIHHEDVRRANDLPKRANAPELNEALWEAGLLLTSFPEFLPGREGIQVALPDGRTKALGGPTQLRLKGEAGEVLLYLAGRTGAARVEVSGDPSAAQLSV